ncbi:MAG: hypothetical protein LUD73_01725, partial [Lachnospiraceae bacterium]|nr:hypothetical protein [Lachnospiraceae bacterium]
KKDAQHNEDHGIDQLFHVEYPDFGFGTHGRLLSSVGLWLYYMRQNGRVCTKIKFTLSFLAVLL